MNTSLANKGLERDSHMYTESMYLEREKTRLVSAPAKVIAKKDSAVKIIK